MDPPHCDQSSAALSGVVRRLKCGDVIGAHAPTAIPPELQHSFDLVVVDPPFITQEVSWCVFSGRGLVRGGGRVDK